MILSRKFMLVCAVSCSAVALAACGDCPSEPHVKLKAEQSAGLTRLDTVVEVEAGSHAQSELDNACNEGNVRIEQCRWDLDGDGVFEVKASRPEAQQVHFEMPGTYWVSIEVKDEQGHVARDQIQLEVLEDSPESVLNTVELELRAMPESPCAKKICVNMWTRLKSLSLDEVRVVNASSNETLLAATQVALSSVPSEVGCVQLAPNAPRPAQLTIVSVLAGKEWPRLTDLPSSYGCPQNPGQ